MNISHVEDQKLDIPELFFIFDENETIDISFKHLNYNFLCIIKHNILIIFNYLSSEYSNYKI